MDRAVEAAELVAQIVAASEGAESIAVVEIPPAPTNEGRLTDDPAVAPLIEHALEVREAHRVPFWTAVMLRAEQTSTTLPHELFTAATFHQPMHDLEHVRLATTGLGASLREAVASASTTVVVRSAVAMSNETIEHIPMLDLRIRPSDGNLETARRATARLGLPGWLLDSGNSYHFYGSSLLGWESMLTWLANASLLAPIVDSRWIAHQLIERTAALRISASPSTGVPPRLVASTP